MELIKLTRHHYSQLAEMIDEWKNDIELNNTNKSPWAIFKNDYHDFDYYLNNLEVKEAKDSLVTDSVFFLYDEKNDKLIGAVNICHSLNNYLLKEGGHIGYGIRPSERQKGYATLMLGLALNKCWELGLTKVLLVCDKSNIASAKTIIKNGGILENEVISSEGAIIQRYWITLDK